VNKVPAQEKSQPANRSIYLCVVEKTTTGYSAFVPDVPGVAVANADLGKLKEAIEDALYLHLADEVDPPESVTSVFRDEDVEVFDQFFVSPSEPDKVSLLIDDLIKKSGVNRTELARILDVPKSSISRLTSPIYRGHSMATLRRIADALGYKVQVMFEKAG